MVLWTFLLSATWSIFSSNNKYSVQYNWVVISIPWQSSFLPDFFSTSKIENQFQFPFSKDEGNRKNHAFLWQKAWYSKFNFCLHFLHAARKKVEENYVKRWSMNAWSKTFPSYDFQRMRDMFSGGCVHRWKKSGFLISWITAQSQHLIAYKISLYTSTELARCI